MSEGFSYGSNFFFGCAPHPDRLEPSCSLRAQQIVRTRGRRLQDVSGSEREEDEEGGRFEKVDRTAALDARLAALTASHRHRTTPSRREGRREK